MNEHVPRLEVRILAGEVAVWQADPSAPAPALRDLTGPLVSVTHTTGELSGVCPADCVPDVATRVERGWSVLEVAGPLDLALTGVLASLAAPLADAGVSIFALSTFDTDYLLVRTSMLTAATAALRAAGHNVS